LKPTLVEAAEDTVVFEEDFIKSTYGWSLEAVVAAWELKYVVALRYSLKHTEITK